jgi:mono/diheme cytochrome c family protein
MIALVLALALLLAQIACSSPAPVPPRAGQVAADVPPAALTFSQRCSQCHGADGRGQTGFGREMKVPDFTSEAWQASITDEQILHTITYGKKGKSMAAFGRKLKPAEIASLVPYLRALGRSQKDSAAR